MGFLKLVSDIGAGILYVGCIRAALTASGTHSPVIVHFLFLFLFYFLNVNVSKILLLNIKLYN